MKLITDRIESDPLAKTIVEMIEAMKADYGMIFKKQFEVEDELKQYKRRLYKKLQGTPISAIIEGYELFVDKRLKFCPTIPELLESIEEVLRLRKVEERNQRRHEYIEQENAKPKPERKCDPIAMLSEARLNSGIPTRKEMDERIAKHEELLKAHKDKIRTVTPKADHLYKQFG
jgi:hypothetical protein